MMNQWLMPIPTERLNLRFDDLCGCGYWKDLFSGCLPWQPLDQRLDMEQTAFFILCGPSGRGKATLSMALASELAVWGYECFEVPAFLLVGDSAKEARQHVDALFNEILAFFDDTNHTGCYIDLGNMEKFCERQECLWGFTRGLEFLKDKNLPCVITASADGAKRLPAGLKKLGIVCPIGLPDGNERWAYLDVCFINGGERIDGLPAGAIPRDPALSLNDMEDLTQGFDYGALHTLVQVCKRLLKGSCRRGGDYLLSYEQFINAVDQVKSGLVQESSMTAALAAFLPQAAVQPQDKPYKNTAYPSAESKTMKNTGGLSDLEGENTSDTHIRDFESKEGRWMSLDEVLNIKF